MKKNQNSFTFYAEGHLPQQSTCIQPRSVNFKHEPEISCCTVATKHTTSDRSHCHVSPSKTGRPLNRTDGNHVLFSGQKKTTPTVEESCCTSVWEPLHLRGSAALQLKLTVSLLRFLLKLFTGHG